MCTALKPCWFITIFKYTRVCVPVTDMNHVRNLKEHVFTIGNQKFGLVCSLESCQIYMGVMHLSPVFNYEL